MAAKKRKQRSSLRTALIISCVVMGMLLAMMLSVTVYAEYLLGRMNYYPDDPRESLSADQINQILNETDPEDDYTGATMSADDISDEGAGEILPTSENVINILLIGADYQSGDMARSDSMILCTFNKTKNTITMTSRRFICEYG